MIDSADRVTGTPSNNFSIVPGQQLISGHFTRAAVQEIVMDWGIPNVGTFTQNNSFIINSPVAVDTYVVDISGNVYEGETPIPTYYDVIDLSDGVTISRNPLILVNGIPTPIIPAELPLIDPEGAPIDVSGAPLIGEVLALTLGNRFRTVASIMTEIARAATSGSTGSYVTYTISGSNNFGCTIISTLTAGGTVSFNYNSGALATQLGLFPAPGVSTNVIYPANPNIMPWRYVDMVCDQLTYCQDVKDSTTNNNQKDVLYRWYFAWDDSPNYDVYGFPILQGYTAFAQRRCIGFPKQIKWDPIQTVSNLKFESYGAFSSTTNANYIPVPPNILGNFPGSGYEFQMTLLLSEI
jgi:hypothetical protein